MHRRQTITRRSLLKSSAAAAGAVLAGIRHAPAFAADSAESPKDEATVIDCHAHLHRHSDADYREKDRLLIEAADKLGIEKLFCSILTASRPATAEGFRECNIWLAEAIERFPGRVLGYCYV
ncbi:MAG: amidohydrolase, partial [Planctomycetota bacterium]